MYHQPRINTIWYVLPEVTPMTMNVRALEVMLDVGCHSCYVMAMEDGIINHLYHKAYLYYLHRQRKESYESIKYSIVDTIDLFSYKYRPQECSSYHP